MPSVNVLGTRGQTGPAWMGALLPTPADKGVSHAWPWNMEGGGGEMRRPGGTERLEGVPLETTSRFYVVLVRVSPWKVKKKKIQSNQDVKDCKLKKTKQNISNLWNRQLGSWLLVRARCHFIIVNWCMFGTNDMFIWRASPASTPNVK